MNKLELISALKNHAGISKSEAARVVQIFFDSMTDAMARGERVEIRGLCSFYVKTYKSYVGRNPKPVKKSPSVPNGCRSSNREKSLKNVLICSPVPQFPRICPDHSQMLRTKVNPFGSEGQKHHRAWI